MRSALETRLALGRVLQAHRLGAAADECEDLGEVVGECFAVSRALVGSLYICAEKDLHPYLKYSRRPPIAENSTLRLYRKVVRTK